MFTPIWERFRFFELYFQVGLKRPPRWVTVGDGISTRYSSGWDGICMFFFFFWPWLRQTNLLKLGGLVNFQSNFWDG